MNRTTTAGVSRKRVPRALLTSASTAALITAALAGAPPSGAAGPIESMPLWRLQARITTCAATEAAHPGTTGTPALRFNGTSTGVRWVKPPSSTALAPGAVTTFDLGQFRRPSDITMLRLGVTGSNDWCVKRLELFFNNRKAFSASPSTATRTIKAGKVITYSSTALRGNWYWRHYGTPPALPSSMSAAHLRSLVTSATGSALATDPRHQWNLARAPLTITRNSSHSFTVSMGLKEVDPTGIDPPNAFILRYSVLLYAGTDGLLHARLLSGDGHGLSPKVIAQLDTALRRMTVRPLPHDPLRFGITAFNTIAWQYVPVIHG